jgi:branched-chain amino acid transport system permease protein
MFGIFKSGQKPMAKRYKPKGLHIVLIIALVFLLFPIAFRSAYARHLIILAMVYAILASNWDLSLGYAGIYNFAHGAFFAIGAYGAAITARQGFSPWLGFLGGGIAAVIVSAIVCLRVLRVKGIYVCLVTFAFSQLCLHIVRSQVSLTGGAVGLTNIPTLTIGGFSLLDHGNLGFYYLSFALLAASTVYLYKLVKSDFGLSIVALRDFEDYAISRGVPLARQRFLTFIASAFFTGLAGGIFSLYSRVAVVELFSFTYLTTLLSMVILGGIATIFGPIIGAFALTIVSEFLKFLGSWQYIIIAVAVVLILMYYPDGIFGGINSVAKRFLSDKRNIERI